MGKASEDEVLELLTLMFELSDEIHRLRISIASLKVWIATQLQPGQLEEALKAIESLEQHALAVDPTRTKRQRDADVIDALQKLRKRGTHEPDS